MRFASRALLLLVSFSAFAQPYDHVVAGSGGTCLIILPAIWMELERTGQNPSHERTDIATIAPAPNGRIFAAVGPFSGFYVGELRPDGTITRITATYPLPAQAMVVGGTGAIYVLAGYQTAPTQQLYAFDPGGTLLASYTLTDGPYTHLENHSQSQTAIDLAADQCTLFMIRDGTVIRRFDVCSGSLLADFAAVQSPPARSVRILPDGGVIVGAGNYRLERYDAAGTFVRSYPLNGPVQALMLRDGGANLTYGETDCDGARLTTIDLTTGNTLLFAQLQTEVPNSIVAWFGWTAAIGDAHFSEVPAAGTIALLVIGLMTAMIALLRLRA